MNIKATKVILSGLFFLSSFNVFSSYELKCLVPDAHDAANVLKAIEASPTCYDAQMITTACGFGSRIDIGLVEAALVICEKQMPVLLRSAKSAKDKMFKHCQTKYKDLTGSEYQSATAFCTLNVVSTFQSVYLVPGNE